MDSETLELCAGLVDAPYIRAAVQARAQRQALIKNLLSHRGLPDEGWDDLTIELFLQELALMDSNNFVENVGVGEREARIASKLVARRHYNLGHGIGRSGDIAAVQPKAAGTYTHSLLLCRLAHHHLIQLTQGRSQYFSPSITPGSSLLVKLTNALALHALRIAGGGNKAFAESCLVLPLATGMAVSLALLTLKQMRPDTARYVLWPRMDQKSCLKSIQTAGFIPVVIPNLLEGDEVRTDLPALERKIAELGAESILCVLSTSSCFAPRAPDRIVEIAQMCKASGIGHIINNAYGVQTSKPMHLIMEACRLGRVDCFVQSTDKNFLVPVGGAIVAGPSRKFIEELNKAYPGRASASPIIDLFITLLSLGVAGWKKLLRERKELFGYFTAEMAKVAEKHGERFLATPNNPISFGMTLGRLGDVKEGPTMLGSMLFSRCCSGTRIVTGKEKKAVAGIVFEGYGAHVDGYPTAYATAACALGLTRGEVDLFLARLDKTLTEIHHQKRKKTTPEAAAATSAGDCPPPGIVQDGS